MILIVVPFIVWKTHALHYCCTENFEDSFNGDILCLERDCLSISLLIIQVQYL